MPAPSNRRRHAAKVDAARRDHDETGDLDAFNQSMLAGAIYRLQGRNRDGRFSGRIRELTAEQIRRREQAT